MLQKEQFLKIPEVFETTSESSEAENSKPSNTPSSSQSYVLKSTQLRPASSYAKPSNTERRKIVTVPYKPTVKLPCELLKPIRKLNFISNKTVSKTASYNPRDDAIALKNIKEKIYQKNYLKINEDVCKEIQKQIVPSSESSDSEIGVSLPIKKPKARRNTTAKSPKKETKIKITPKKPSKIKVPKKKVIKESELI